MTDHAPLIERAFALATDEQAADIEPIDGTLPDFLTGRYYVNGPARFSRGVLRYRNWLDGDGMVCALDFSRRPIRFTNRFVRSTKFTAEEAAGTAVYRTFGTAFPGDALLRGMALESPINVSVYWFNGHLLAFGEQSVPWELDPQTLETKGPFRFRNQVNEATPFSAHPKVDPATGEMFTFGVSFSSASPALIVFRFGADGALKYRRRVPLPYACSIHDFALSQRYSIFHVAPYLLDIAKVLHHGAALIDTLEWHPERGSRLIGVSRESGALEWTIPAGHGYCLHVINAFEQGDRLIVDVVEYERPLYDQYQIVPDLFSQVSPGRPLRLDIDLRKGAIVDRRVIAYDRAPDFPAHDPELTGRPYDRFWMLGISAAGQPGRKFFDELVAADWSDPEGRVDIYRCPRHHYLGGEPVFVPQRAGDSEGVVICQGFDAAACSSAFLVFDARHVSRGPVARLPLASPIPLLFHAVFQAGEVAAPRRRSSSLS
jgi:all-trans-8'-apo-beta-carotenal 15,15'-oxygenase